MTTSVGTQNRQVRWAAKLDHVREVSLLGSADLAWWKDRLSAEDLVPAEKEACAQILIVAAEGKFMGLTFRELSFSVFVAAPKDEPEPEGCFLVQAFNSRHFFAFCERVFFSTPYYFGDVRLSASLPAAVELVLGGKVAFRAAMSEAPTAAGSRPAPGSAQGWEGPVYLPTNRPGKSPQRMFFAKIAGETLANPFSDKDTLAIHPSLACPVLQMLHDSHFTATQWLVRPDAIHAKSRTYTRTGLVAY